MMTINDQIRDGKLQYDIDIKAAEISAKSSENFRNMNILLVKIYYHLMKNK